MNNHDDCKAPNKEKLFKTFHIAKLEKNSHVKKVDEILGLKKRNKKLLTTKTKKMLIEMARAAHKLDKSQSLTEYYQLFLDRLRKKYRENS